MASKRLNRRERRVGLARKPAPQFGVVINGAAHEGHYVGQLPQDDSWREQDYTGSHGTLCYFESESQAKAWLEDYLQCDSQEKGYYCYSHNPGCR